MMLSDDKTTTDRMNPIGLELLEWLPQMESVLEVLNEGVIIIDESQRILFANSQFLEMTGFSPQELYGEGPSLFYSAKEWTFLMQQADIAFRKGRNRYTFQLAQKSGPGIPVIISSRSLQKSTGRFGIVTFTDISEQVRIEDQLRCANTKLQERQMEIEEDLRLAERVQKSLRPKSVTWDTMRVEAFYHPVHSIGGDFALISSQDRDNVSLLVCDVSGHGIGSALVANRIYSETTAHLRSSVPFAEMFGELNRFLIEDIAGSGMFVTAAAAKIDVPRRRMVFAGAGHPPAMLARNGKNPILLESRNMILGAFPDAMDPCGSFEVELEPDDRIIVYTDGITEAFNRSGEMLGIEGFQEIVRKASALPEEEMKQGLVDAVAAWRSGPPTDDVSLVLAHIR
jgi:PAS domain S-box-containing protein